MLQEPNVWAGSGGDSIVPMMQDKTSHLKSYYQQWGNVVNLNQGFASRDHLCTGCEIISESCVTLAVIYGGPVQQVERKYEHAEAKSYRRV